MDISNLALQAGNYELAVGNTLIPSDLLGDLIPNYSEGEISSNTQGGVTVTPNGKAETSQFQFTMYLPQDGALELLGAIWPELYTAATDSNGGGQLNFGSASCRTRTPVPMNIHNKCEPNDKHDVYIPAALAKIEFNPTFSATAVSQITVTVYMQPDANGNRMRYGRGDLTQLSRYDVTTGKTVPITTE